MGVFSRGLSDEFVSALKELAQKPGWWRDVLSDSSLILGIRKECFDVYWSGQSLFNATLKGGEVKVNTHIKYLLDPDRSERVPLEKDGRFDDVRTPILTTYTSATLDKLKRAAGLFSGSEKQGVHSIVKANENVVDVEIRLDARELGLDRKHPRIDIAAFEQQSDGIELVFWEAKLFANKELRAEGCPPVVQQIKEYRQVLVHREAEVVSSYRRVAKNLVSIGEMSGRAAGPAIRAVADGKELRISSPPKVGLVIFGFDSDQSAEEGVGHRHFQKLNKELGRDYVRTGGNAKNVKLGPLG